MKVYPRKCDITNEGMEQGYCIEDGLMYIKYEADFIKHLREIDPMQEELSDDFLLNDYYQNDYYYWTEWEELDDDINYTIDGIEVLKNLNL